jgi:hypothetical protein
LHTQICGASFAKKRFAVLLPAEAQRKLVLMSSRTG